MDGSGRFCDLRGSWHLALHGVGDQGLNRRDLPRVPPIFFGLGWLRSLAWLVKIQAARYWTAMVAAAIRSCYAKTMLGWNRTGKFVCAAVAIATYFAFAAWSMHSYVDPVPKGKIVTRLPPPFEKSSSHPYLFVAHYIASPSLAKLLDGLADSTDSNERSPVVLYEGDRRLGPAHSLHGDIARLGGGRYSHWLGQGFVFSTSDNSDPNTNGRVYWAIVPY